MGLFDDIQTANASSRGGIQCSIRRILTTMNKEDAKTLTEALNDPAIRSTAIRKALIANGYPTSDGVVARHRRKECVCES